jgi:hypothetical protein
VEGGNPDIIQKIQRWTMNADLQPSIYLSIYISIWPLSHLFVVPIFTVFIYIKINLQNLLYLYYIVIFANDCPCVHIHICICILVLHVCFKYLYLIVSHAY